MNVIKLLGVISFIFMASCSREDEYIPESRKISFDDPVKVLVTGYDDNIMEPFLSRDGNTLFFNNSNDPLVNTNLHYASRLNDSVFQYRGEISGTNTEYLEGVASMDNSNKLYFISNRSYDETLATIYCGDYTEGNVTNVQIVSGISKDTPGWVNFDVEISSDGNYMFAVDGRFDAIGGPYEANLMLAVKKGNAFERTDNSLLEYVNSDALEYAACISSDMLELYFTRVATTNPEIYYSSRVNINAPFGQPKKIGEITGFVEAPTISPDDNIIYFHKMVNGKFELFMVKKLINTNSRK
ncbi:MAG: PD40 domain-containing protein [Bacteroidales bacterium]|nr:PD40 domain-containing protein [Bacteroidales bacterium]